jgi:hypothetical protein
MKFALLAALVGLAAAECDTSTCSVCVAMPGCWWYGSNESTGFADCRKNGSVPSALASTFPRITPCPVCQAGTCTLCQNQTGCNWYDHSVPGVDSVCSATTPPTPGGIGSYSMVNTCPVCADRTDCNSCYLGPSACAWYVLAGTSSGGKCAEASPGFAYSKRANGFCNGNPCSGVPTCSRCKNTTDSNNNTGVCSWYDSKIPALYNAKCEQNATSNVASKTAYTENTGVCPACAGTNCGDCQADSLCQWVAVQAGALGSSFGQCILKTGSVSGKTTVTTCATACEVHTCTACIAKPECRWYTSSFQDPVCDRASDAFAHPGADALTTGATCPACSADRCYECSSLSGCGWYRETILGKAVPFTSECLGTSSGTGKDKLDKDDEDCEGNPKNGASGLVPGLALLFAFLFHN